MNDLTASLLTLLLISPSVVVLAVLIARRVTALQQVGVPQAKANLREAKDHKFLFPCKLCRGTS